MSDEMPELEGGDAFVPLEDTNAVIAEGEIPAENAADPAAAVAEVPQNIPVEVEKRKKRVSLYWKRPKSHLYEYNYGRIWSYPVIHTYFSTDFLFNFQFNCRLRIKLLQGKVQTRLYSSN